MWSGQSNSCATVTVKSLSKSWSSQIWTRLWTYSGSAKNLRRFSLITKETWKASVIQSRTLLPKVTKAWRIDIGELKVGHHLESVVTLASRQRCSATTMWLQPYLMKTKSLGMINSTHLLRSRKISRSASLMARLSLTELTRSKVCFPRSSDETAQQINSRPTEN